MPATESKRVTFTHIEKMMFPEAGVTKGDLLAYYAQISPRLLPHLKDRPITVERLPDGLSKPNAPRFWQKNTPEYYPKWIPRVNIPTEDGRDVHYALINDLDALLYFVNQGAITFHTFFSRVNSLKNPDFVLFDLDVGDAKFTDAVKIAQTIRKLLDAQKAKSFPKTSGKRGLHVLVPWKRPGGYPAARAWAVEVAASTVKARPNIATTERSIAKRGNRVYVDVMQNDLGKHVVPPYIVRATPLATVSTPLDWEEVANRLNPEKFTMPAVLARAKRAKQDPMKALLG
jgi:bifunctional non-homologous end joining protein LigD